MDRVVFDHHGARREVEGRTVVEAANGGVLLLARDGALWRIGPDEIVTRSGDDRPFVPLSRDELAEKLLVELPLGFEAHKTAHYVIVHNASRAYARWCGALFERLYRAFANEWKRRGLRLSEPEFPLVAIVFGDRASYLRYARAELGESAASIVGYYHLETNRMAMCDLTGISSLARGQRVRGDAQINAILSRPAALLTVATVVHEATHQIAYNRGLHPRLGECPLWLAEGLAIYFETPDLGSSKGWRGIGEVNHKRLARFAQYTQHRPADSLATLIRDDTRFRDMETAEDAYAEAWALTWFLIRKRSDDYVEYLKMVSRKKPLVGDSPKRRLKEFEAVFGDLDQLDRDFVRYMERQR